MTTAQIYQALYEQTNYGRAEMDLCPGVRYLPHYVRWLKGDVVDFGCGSGDTLRAIRSLGFRAIGIDWIDSGELTLDITEDIELDHTGTGICIDVFEHISDEGLAGLINNLRKCERQAISVFSGSHKVDGTELHINQKSIPQWDKYITWHFEIVERHVLNEQGNRVLYLTENFK